MKPDQKQVIGQTSADVTQLVEILAAAKMGDFISYKHMTRMIGRDVTVYRHLLASARRIALRDYNAVFAPVLGEGIRRLDNVETVELCPEGRRKRIRSQVRKGSRELAAVSYEALPEEQRRKHNVGLAMFGGLYLGTSRKTLKAIASKVDNDKTPDQGELMKLIGWMSDDD